MHEGCQTPGILDTYVAKNTCLISDATCLVQVSLIFMSYGITVILTVSMSLCLFPAVYPRKPAVLAFTMPALEAESTWGKVCHSVSCECSMLSNQG